MTELCTYCLLANATTGDHIFPEFLGGPFEVRACPECNNNRLGAKVEGPAALELAGFAVALAMSGYKHPRLVTAKSAVVHDKTGIALNLDSSLRLVAPSPVAISTERAGVFQVLAPSPRVARQYSKMIRAREGAAAVSITAGRSPVSPENITLRMTAGPELRRLALKMAVAVAHHHKLSADVVSSRARSFLLDQRAEDSDFPIRLVMTSLPALDDSRAPLAHHVYLEGGARSDGSVAYVQLYGCGVQFFMTLNPDYHGPTFAVKGELDIRSFQERFEISPPLFIERPARYVEQAEYLRQIADRLDRFNAETELAFGKCGFRLTKADVTQGL